MAQTATLSAKQMRAIDCLLAASSVVAAAECCKVNRSTLYRWMADDTFKQALDAAQRALISTAVRRLASGLEKSVTTTLHLVELSEDESIRLRAAIAIPAMLQSLSENYDLSERIAALETALLSNHANIAI